jgi:bifunctional UDP-N-acetylglucosamine pyrophosphorylase/glucosamine-1-phosphate N-acetyltransferase
MQCVILAAGKGTRMGDLTTFTPKPMLSIGGKPILDYKIRHLPKEIDEVILVVGYNRDMVREYFGNAFAGKRISYVLQDELNGTGGALHAARNLLHERFLVIMGDDLYHSDDLQKLLGHDIALLAYPLENDTIFGIVTIDESGHLRQVIEKSQAHKGDLANTGAYMLNKSFFQHPLVSVGNAEYGLPQTMATMTSMHRIAVIIASHWRPITNAADLSEAEKMLPLLYSEGLA